MLKRTPNLRVIAVSEPFSARSVPVFFHPATITNTFEEDRKQLKFKDVFGGVSFGLACTRGCDCGKPKVIAVIKVGVAICADARIVLRV